MSRQIDQYTSSELKNMLPFILAADGAAAGVSLAVGFIFGFDWRLFTGLAVGNLLMAANFILIGYTVSRTVKCRDFRRGRRMGTISYFLRYAGIFAVLALLLSFKLISLVTAVLPLFYPKIYYTFIYMLTRGKDDG